jgi:molybdopterin-containing oxidoreductase family membrane subunit
MRASKKASGLVGVFAHHDALLDSIKEIEQAGFTIREVYSPVPSHELIEAVRPGVSPVRFLTFAGALTGLVGGFALAIWSSLQWNLVVGGKPVTSIVPFMVVGFELLILLGAIATFTGLALFARLPHVKFPDAGFRPEFTKDRFGLWLDTPEKRVDEAKKMLEKAGAVDVHRLGGDS